MKPWRRLALGTLSVVTFVVTWARMADSVVADSLPAPTAASSFVFSDATIAATRPLADLPAVAFAICASV